uniref:Uncharacterized protein n=1 Tax=Salmonella sp. TaxID=599 RepID=A0A482ETG8_SALSP|nr:hypothetical protein NNIBIDOC_00080 [Salmonella sp.]
MGEGMVMLALFMHTEDGPVCIWLREKAAALIQFMHEVNLYSRIDGLGYRNIWVVKIRMVATPD